MSKMTHTTSRVISQELEEILEKEFPLLDHGFVRVVDYMGNDSSIVQAARVSYGHGTKHKREDRALIRYLMRNAHSTPFEMCDIKLHIKAPIFVARQWVRHRTSSINEYSARYSIVKEEFYLPDNISVQSEINAQGRGGEVLETTRQYAQEKITQQAQTNFEVYQDLINTHNLAREIARITLPLNTYTEFYWKINLHNLLHFLKLRSDSHAQYEIREYADTLCNIVKVWVPDTYEAFQEYNKNAAILSKSAIETLKQVISGDKTKPDSLSNTEWSDLKKIFDFSDNY